MSRIKYHKDVLKQLAKLRPAERQRCRQRISLYLENPDHPLLNRHQLRGGYKGYISINCGGDLRIVILESENTVEVVTVGTHSQLYS